MAALTSAGLSDLVEAAARPEAHPSAAQLLPITAAAEGLHRLGRLLVSAALTGPRNLAPAAEALLRSGGKRVRPLLTLLAARAAAPDRRSRGRVALAVVAELVHSATLLHDDVIDRGRTDFTQEDALAIAAKKTGSLFGWCGEAGALAARARPAVVAALREFGQR